MDTQSAQGAETRVATPLVFGRVRLWMVMVGVVTILAGILFGYDQGVISGALVFVKREFDLSSIAVEVVTSWVTLGALAGALIAGSFADRFGRKRALVLAGLLFVAGAVIQAATPDVQILVLGRLIIGAGVGVASVAAPLYAAEMAPKESRGRYVSTYQLAITMGIFLAYVADAALTPSESWRWMFGLAIIPGVLLIVAALVIPESPRWLMKSGRRADARVSLVKSSGSEDAEEKLDLIKEDLDASGVGSWRDVFGHRVRKALWIGVGLAVIQQVTGINAIIYYANQIFDRAGFTTAAEQADATLFAVGLVNVLATFIAIAFVDKFGRKPLLLTGLVGMFFSLVLVGAAFMRFSATDEPTGPSLLGIITMIALVTYIISFAFSLGPVVWTVINEIYPNRIRGRAVAVATAVNWLSAFVVTQSFLSLLDEIGDTTTFFLFAGIAVLSFVWIWLKVPETKGRSLEDMEELFDLPPEKVKGLYPSHIDE